MIEREIEKKRERKERNDKRKTFVLSSRERERQTSRHLTLPPPYLE
jgi:hypothetical protein